MVKYKGRAKGKLPMPKMPVKIRYRAAPGYLCNFQAYDGRTRDPVSSKKVSEKGLTMRVALITSPFVIISIFVVPK